MLLETRRHEAVGFFYARMKCKAWCGQAGRQRPQL
jgi:hypothetical protein